MYKKKNGTIMAVACIVLSFAGLTGAAENKQAVIIVPESPDIYESQAAAKLEEYIFKSSKIKYAIIQLKDGVGLPGKAIIMGNAAVKSGGISEDELKKMGDEGYIVRSKDGNVYIAGGNYGGTLNGIYAFLEKEGFRFYAKDDIVIPEKISFGTEKFEDIKSKPFFENRGIAGTENLGFRLQASAEGIDPDLDWKRISWEHTEEFLVPVLYYGKEHPEYYAKDENGNSYATKWFETADRKKEPHIMLCWSNPDVRRIAEERLLMWMKKAKDKKLFFVGQMDGLDWCMCEKCKMLDTVPGKVMTDRVLDFVNDIAKCAQSEFPDKIIMAQAYTYKSAPPPLKHHTLEKNVRVSLAVYPPEVKVKSRGLNHELNKKFLLWYKEWLKKFPGQIYIYDYPYVSFNCANFIHEHYFERIKTYAQDGIKGIYFNSCPFYMFDLFHYVAARLLWDPSLDTQTLVKDFMRSYYGAGNPEILEIYNMLSAIAKRPDRLQGETTDIRNFLTLDECEKILALYERAESNTQKDKTVLKRIREDKSFVLCTMLENENPVSGQVRDIEKFKKRLGELVSIVTVPDSRNGLRWGRPESLESWLWRIARIKVMTSNRATDPVIQKLIHDPQSFHFENKATLSVGVSRVADGYIIPIERFTGAMGPIHYMEKDALKLLSRRYDNFQMRGQFKLEQALKKSALIIGGQDCEKPGSTTIRIEINGKEIFRDGNNMAKNGWAEKKFELPDNIFKKGNNEIVIENMEEEEDPFSKWFLVYSVKIETQEATKILLLSHFDKHIDADWAANPKATATGQFKIAENGKWGNALDCSYSKVGGGYFWYNGPDNFDPEKGTIDMWIKLNADIAKDSLYRTFLMPFGNLSENNTGFIIYKYLSSKDIAVLFYGKGKKQTCLYGGIGNWTTDTWHHVAVTWDRQKNEVQLFLDGILAAKKNNAAINSEIPSRIYVGSMPDSQDKAAGALIDELRITNSVMWQADKVGDKAFDIPTKPYTISHKEK